MGALVQTFALTLESARSFLRAAWSSQRTRSVQISLTKAMRLLSGNHFGAVTPVGTVVTRRASPPSVAITYTWLSLSSPRLDTNAIHLPSGLTVGCESLALSLVS